jgi:hypothetical protein
MVDEVEVLEIKDRRFNFEENRVEWLTLYDDGTEPSWQPKEDFIDSNGVVNEIFEEFEANAENQGATTNNTSQKSNKTKNPLKRTLSESSLLIYEHTQNLADSQVGSDEISTQTDLEAYNKKIKSETKKDIRISRISEREKEKNEISKNLKTQIQQQDQQQSFQALIQLQGLKMMQKMMEDDEKPDPKLVDEVNEMKSDISELKGSLKEILGLLRNRS